MTYMMTPNSLHNYRKRTNEPMPASYRMKKCAGPCNRTHSIGQFAEGDTLCAICRRRA
jgi:hypothetical protein